MDVVLFMVLPFVGLVYLIFLLFYDHWSKK